MVIRHGLLAGLMVCGSLVAMAQEKTVPFMVRITELGMPGFSCTVLTEDGRLRREVMPMDEHGAVSRREVFEGPASNDDISRIKAAVNQPNFRAAANSLSGQTPALMVTRHGRILSVEVNLETQRETVLFNDPNGMKSTPGYLATLVSFTKEVKKRKLPTITGKVDSLCSNFPVLH